MKRLMLALCALMISGMSHAGLNMLDVQLSPDVPVFAKGDVINVTVTDNGVATQYRYVLERWLTEKNAVVMSTWWSSNPEYRIDTAAADIPAGRYRLLTMAREDAKRPETLTRIDVFNVIGSNHPDFAKIADQNEVVSNYDHAVRVVRAEIARVKEKLLAHEDVSVDLRNFQSESALINYVINPDNRSAPSGGGAYMSGAGVTPTGAVGVDALMPPTPAGDWRGVTVRIDLPDYRGLEVISGDVTLTIHWED